MWSLKKIKQNWVVRLIDSFIPGLLKDAARRVILPHIESLPNSPDLFRTYRYLFEHPDLERTVGGWIYMGKFYPDYLTVGGASHAIFREALKYCQGIGIDIGAGLWPLPGAIPVDIQRGLGLQNRVSDFRDRSLDYVFSSHCLEHIKEYRQALIEWTTKLRAGGILFLYLPHPGCAIWHPGSPFVGDGHKWIPTPQIIKQTFQEFGFRIIQFDDGPDAMHSFHVCGRKEMEGNRNPAE